MKCYVLKTPEGLIAINSETELSVDDNCREFTEEEYQAVVEWDQDITSVGNVKTTVTGQDLETATILFHDLSGAEKDEMFLKRMETVFTEIDFLAENMRGRYITPGAGQALAYQAKTEEAKAFQGVVDPVDADYPHLYEEALATSSTVAEVAALVLSTKQSWTQVSAKIEGVRRGAKKAMNSAKSVAEIDQVLSNIVWPDLPKDSSDD